MAAERPIATGYYRYTDIWPQVLPACDGDPLKAVLVSHDALVHPENPLHNKEVQGISMFHDGQSRLLFSSAQIDYIRYWLHAMKLTANLIPMPYSGCLLTQSELSTVSPVIYQDGGSLRGALKTIIKNNKRLNKSSNPKLTSRRDAFERARNFWAAKTGTWCAIDFETWEWDHSAITEFGYSSVLWGDGREVSDSGHFTVKEYAFLTNRKWVPENRTRYGFGDSVEVTKAGLRTKNGPVLLVFHDPKEDIKSVLTTQPLDLNLTDLQSSEHSCEGIYIVDTVVLFAALEGEGQDTRSLERVCRHLQISIKNLHNAGNDAYYTVLALREMAGGEPLDMQRETRWPNHTGDNNAGVKVEFEPYEEDSEYSDQEGVMGRL
ncbi:hypothetical protein DFH09DRAFT_1470295 [Mycena vulgaris]|nr:hypothetical protein DFH09DRAFT_1470295 [Mycena vulgaris]